MHNGLGWQSCNIEEQQVLPGNAEHDADKM